jgi:hypothetical protein
MEKGGQSVNTCKKCIQVYVNAKIIPVETTPGIRGGRDKEKSRGGESMHDICDTLQEACKCHNVPPSSKINEKKRNI